MRIEIDLSAANDPDAHPWLNRILAKIEDGWHVWDTTSLPDPHSFLAATWVRDRGNQGDWVRQLLVASIQRDAWTLAPHGRRVRVTVQPSAADELEPEAAARFAEEPLCILVENRFSDGVFVRRVVTELDQSLHGVWRRAGEPIRIDSVGGAGQMPAEIERRTQKRGPNRPRLVAIADSDRKGPTDTDSDRARALRHECAKRNVACWVLAKREAENYLPRVLLSELQNTGAHHARLVEAWDDLDDDQKNYFDMKNGLPDRPSALEEALFQDLSQGDRQVLSHGFGDNVYKCWTYWNVKAKTELLRRSQGDLERGIELIRKEV